MVVMQMHQEKSRAHPHAGLGIMLEGRQQGFCVVKATTFTP
jgi:hypothetical protein